MGTAGGLGAIAAGASAVPASAAPAYQPAHHRGDPLLRSASRLAVHSVFRADSDFERADAVPGR